MIQGDRNAHIPDQRSGVDGGNLDELILTVARGDQGAFEVLYDQLSGPVYRAVLAIIREAAQAEEVSQEVLLEIWRTAGRFDPAKGSAAAWALTMARRRAIDRVRSVTAGASRETRHAGVAVSWDQVSETVEDIMDRERLTSSLRLLSGPQRQAIMLAFYGGHTYTEVAAILGIAVGTAKGRIRAGLASLREIMHVTP